MIGVSPAFETASSAAAPSRFIINGVREPLCVPDPRAANPAQEICIEEKTRGVVLSRGDGRCGLRTPREESRGPQVGREEGGDDRDPPRRAPARSKLPRVESFDGVVHFDMTATLSLGHRLLLFQSRIHSITKPVSYQVEAHGGKKDGQPRSD